MIYTFSSDIPGEPFFENCPEDTLELPLPLPKDDMVDIPIVWIARDHLNNKLLIRPNSMIVGNTISLRREDLMTDVQQQVILAAEDEHGQTVVCDFSVKVQGKTVCESLKSARSCDQSVQKLQLIIGYNQINKLLCPCYFSPQQKPKKIM